MRLNPCPCTPLQKGCQILAIIDAVLNMLALGLMILAFLAYLRDDDKELSEREKNVGLISTGIQMLVCVMRVALAFRLYYGALNRDRKECRIWLIITAINTTINLITMIVNVSASEFNGAAFGGALAGILYNLYEMFVVFAFLRELKRDSRISGDTMGPVVAEPEAPYHQQPPPPYFPEQRTEIYVVPANAYPMQQLNSVNNSYPAPVHHVTRT